MYNECCCCFYNFFVVVAVVGLVSKLNACWCFSFKWILKRCCCIRVSSSTTNNNKKITVFHSKMVFIMQSIDLWIWRGFVLFRKYYEFIPIEYWSGILNFKFVFVSNGFISLVARILRFKSKQAFRST